ncbi:DDE superfamily endonuclease, CENP-B-like protein [Hirsutella rhossiliensis]|uniref:DDE superfamily endonuclease, CENP-B-like protein n=1 Tax=Hirsutella rhossiliensis TaxID=111463 RepID=A0A9P8SD66_9HYPO|nr:DDE superfamily endonuclease, CENP-B-like protein [Hirsutella rhossiliensis]KAH0957020.1 DDE superfamily endonuclease, CENP-B-like protein [Hirsutella rhossiliensis]
MALIDEALEFLKLWTLLTMPRLRIGEKIEKYDILPCNTYNVDEKGFSSASSIVPRVFSVRAKKQGKLIGAAQDGNRSWITFLACVCQDLTALPLLSSTKASQGKFRTPGSRSLIRSTSGVFHNLRNGKGAKRRDYRLLITDGHSSHVNMDFLEWCDQHRIIVAVFPPHSTHRLQPLMCPFGPLRPHTPTSSSSGLQRHRDSSGYRNASSGRYLERIRVIFSAENIASGWKRTGLLPFDPEVVLSQIAEKTEDESDSPLLDLRRLVDKVVDGSSKTLAETVGSSKYFESLQSQNELLRYENQGLRETIFHEKQRRMRGKA